MKFRRKAAWKIFRNAFHSLVTRGYRSILRFSHAREGGLFYRIDARGDGSKTFAVEKEYTTFGPPWTYTGRSPFSTNFTLTSNTYRSGAREGIDKQIFKRRRRRPS